MGGIIRKIIKPIAPILKLPIFKNPIFGIGTSLFLSWTYMIQWMVILKKYI